MILFGGILPDGFLEPIVTQMEAQPELTNRI
jgi:hypothetical protein